MHLVNRSFSFPPSALKSASISIRQGQLENAVLRGIHLTKTDSIRIEDLGLQGKAEEPIDPTAVPPEQRRCFSALKRAAIEAFEREYLTRLMSEHQGNVSHAARTAGKDRRDFGNLLKKYRLNPRFFWPQGSSSTESLR